VTDVQDEDVEALTSLGLTMLQAKVYLTLVESENSTIKEIAKNTGIARQDLYRITSELQECGLVEQIITKPIMYKAIPLTNGVNILLNELQKKRNDAQKKVTKLLQRYETKEVTAKTKMEKNQFVLVPGKNAFILKEKALLNNAQKTVSFITSKQRFSQKLYSLIEEFKKATAKGVKIRILIEKTNPETHWNPTNKPTKNPKETASFEIRYIINPPPVVMSVFDNKEVILVASANAGLTESPALWSNNPSLVELAHNYFEILWITAIETNNPIALKDLKREGTFALF
jgi:sugar-specific transcriptional regulator TrmB